MERHFYCYFLALILVQYCFVATSTATKNTSIATDQSALLALKAHITSDPHQFLSRNWSSNSATSSVVCDWIGVKCGSKHQRVTALNISSMSLKGTIPPELGNLSFLVSLDVGSNYFHGNPLPQELSRLHRLRFIRLSSNNFSGEIPMWFCRFPELQFLSLYNNNFSGPIPSSISNLSKLERLSFKRNSLNGKIPEQIGNLSRLTFLNLESNQLIGSIPLEIFNISTLEIVAFTFNNLIGTLPDNICHHVPNLKRIFLSANQIHGQIPSSLSQCSQLEILSLSFNKFSGSIPKEISNLQMLQVLYLGSNNLQEKIPEQMGNLSSLTDLNLQSNQLIGSIPLEIFNISTLELVAFTFNNLTGTLPTDICHHVPNLKRIYLSANQIHGQIPSSLSQCSQLEILSLSFNKFSGSIPKEISNLQMLQVLYLGSNNLQGVIPREIGNLRNLTIFGIESNQITGSIPKEIGNLTRLTFLGFTENLLTGAIPEEICNLHKLEKLYLISNNLNGSIPTGIFNLSKLSAVTLAFNHLTGNLPPNIGHQLPDLERFLLHKNNIGGVIPASIVNCSKLNHLELQSNQFTGSIPNNIGNLELLEYLNLSFNNLTSDPTYSELEFLNSLTKCKYLTTLLISGNPLNGFIPASVGNLSTSLKYFYAGASNIKGPIPNEIGNLSSLIAISLEDNQLTGVIPRTIQDLENLQLLSLVRNKLRGSLDNFCSMHSLADLYLDQNQISGLIPDCFGNMTSLRSLYLYSNLVSSTIPRSLWKLRDLLVLDLASNSLVGSLPLEIGNLKAAISIDVSMNQISGDIPAIIGDLQNLQNLSLAQNRLQGLIPESFGNMFSLTSLDLSNNSLSGLIPKSLEKLQYLNALNVSFNHLKGEIPFGGPFRNFTSESFIFNDALCGDAKFHVPPCQSDHPKHKPTLKKVLLLTFVPLGISILVVLALIFLRYRLKEKVPSATDLLPVLAEGRVLYYFELLQATNGYSDSNLLGSGSFGSVYKAILNDGSFVAVKVFNLQLEGGHKSFDVECKALCNLRHRNLVKVINSCSNHDFKALVLEYMCNGSLEKWLYSPNYFLNIFQRLEIMIDVANALQYLHHEYSTPVIHCDLKPSNVLIDEDMVARVSDFGIAKFLGKEESTAFTKTFATIGYMAPEYGLEGLVSTACDVYSFGILLMEVFTRRRPSDEMFNGNLSLKSWVNDSMPNAILQVIDTDLLKPDGKHFTERLECLSLIMGLALNCVRESPKERLNMKIVVNTLQKIKQKIS
ncbi:hypothetical protein ACH5RR_039772 [Cinchona calisaya]|uniref:non-specific serine/threonine protein kinase n=1 Tax=Cinchona calisaya TaxID=153742 RepID=A0ABD2Y2R0_9GENT